MSDIKVSVIMPVYGVEDYVGKAIERIQAQTLNDWEFFCVDDGTKDRSGEICDEYAARDSRIKVIHKENGGAPSAGNVAIDKAVGKYMYFMDSDDWAEPDMLEKMVAAAEKNNSQLVVSGYYIDTYYSNTEKFTQEQVCHDAVYNTKGEFRRNAYALFDKNLLYTPWNKLYLSSYILENKLYFPQTFWDDFPFNLSVVRNVERVCVLSDKFYHFIRKRAESETAKYRSDMYDKREEEKDRLEELFVYRGVDSPESKELIARRYIERIIGCVGNVTNRNRPLFAKEKKAEFKRIISTERVKNAVRTATPNSKYMKIMLAPIKRNSAGLTYLEGKVVSRVKSGDIKTFAKLKAGR